MIKQKYKADNIQPRAWRYEFQPGDVAVHGTIPIPTSDAKGTTSQLAIQRNLNREDPEITMTLDQ